MKIELVLLSCFVAFTAATDQCVWGESYWCSSLKNAKDCGAFQHCFTTVWKNQKLAKDNGDLCQYCENVITEVRDFITNKQTEAQIKQYLDAACAIIPDAQLAAQCKDYADNYLSEMLDLISSELDPQTVCSLIGLCTGLEDMVQHSMPENRVPSMKIPAAQLEPICTDCKKFMTDIKDMITSPMTEQQIEQMLDQTLCTQLGSFVDECKALVEAYVPELMELLTGEFDPAQICGMAGFCNGSTVGCPLAMLAKMRLQKSPLFQEAQKLADSAECEICKTILGEVQIMDKDPAIQAEIKTFLKDEICAHLGTLKNECDDTVETFAPELFELISTELDPETRCKSLGFCVAGNIVVPTQPKKSAVKDTVRSSAQCIMCEFVIKEVDDILGDNTTEAEIIAALDKVCSLMPTTIQQECMDFVNTYSKAIIEMLKAELNPDQVCIALGLCSSTRPVIKVRQSEVCGVCETIIGYVDAILEQNATVQELEAAMEKVCNFLPETYRSQCDQIVEQYGPRIVQLLAQFADPSEICTLIGLCKNTNVVDMVNILPAKAHLLGTNECTYGPAFWCQNHANAEKCKAVEHCKKHVWN